MKKRKIFVTLFILMCCFIAHAQWSDDPLENNLITPVGASTYDFEARAASNGNVFVTYTRPMGGNIATVLQIIDTEGNMLFSDEGLMISHKETLSWTMVSQLSMVDRDGNVIISVADCRNNTDPLLENMSYTLYKVSPTGEMLWGENGIDLSEGEATEMVACMTMVQIEDGSYICAWVSFGFDDNASSILMQRISPTGELLWSENDIPQFNASYVNYPYLVNAGNNQVILVYVRGSGNYVTARKIDFDGSSVWPEDLYVYRGGFTIPPIWVIIRVIPDQMGGAFVGWYDDRYNSFQECTYVSHVTSNGTLGFSSGENGERVGYSDVLRGFSPEMYFDKENSVLYVAYRETTSGQGRQQITGQKISIPSGELLWDIEGKAIGPQDDQVAYYSIQGDGKGNVAVFYESNSWDPVYYYGWIKNYVTLLDSNGDYVWDDEIILFADTPSMKGDMVSTRVINNSYWVTFWDDERKLVGDNGSKKIYMQRINIDGTLGRLETGISYSKNSSLTVYSSGKMINIINPENKYIESVQLFDISGRMINDYKVFGSDNVLITTNINESVVIVKINGKNEIETHKIIVK